MLIDAWFSWSADFFSWDHLFLRKLLIFPDNCRLRKDYLVSNFNSFVWILLVSSIIDSSALAYEIEIQEHLYCFRTPLSLSSNLLFLFLFCLKTWKLSFQTGQECPFVFWPLKSLINWCFLPPPCSDRRGLSTDFQE